MTHDSEHREVPGGIDISVVIVSWNTGDLVTRALASVEREAEAGRLRVECIVVDNASSDGTVERVADLFPAVSVVALTDNLGFASANNLGIARSRGATVLLLNPDTELWPGSLRALWNVVHASAHVGLVGGLLLNPDGTLQSAGYRFPGLTQTFLDLFPIHPRLVASSLNGRARPGDGLSPIAIDHPLGACMLVRRAVIDQVGMLDDGYFMYSEEIDWCRRIKAAGWTILTAPAARLTHHGGQSTRQIPDQMFLELHRSRRRYFRRYHSPGFVAAIGCLFRGAAAVQKLRARLRSLDPQAARRAMTLTEVADLYRHPRSCDV